MMRPGLLSITFRSLSAAEIVRLASEAGLEGVEWGGDVHSPHGDAKIARELAKMSRDAGLELVSYGSYYKLGASEEAGLPFERVLESAVALGVPRVRVWAGVKGSKDCAPEARAKAAEDLARVAGLSAKAGVAISLEYHLNTLADAAESALAFLKEAGAPGVLVQWQPVQGREPEANSSELKMLLGRLGNLHVFHWSLNEERKVVRHPLSEGRGVWGGWLEMASAAPSCQWAMLEFVKDDSPEQMAEDARTLRETLKFLG